MKKIIYILLLLIPFIANSQITVTSVNTQKVKTVIENHFLGGGVTVSNVRFNGDTMGGF